MHQQLASLPSPIPKKHSGCLSYPLGLKTWAHTCPKPTLPLQSYIHTSACFPSLWSVFPLKTFPLLHWSMMTLHDLVHMPTLTLTMWDYSVRFLLSLLDSCFWGPATSYSSPTYRAYSQNRKCDLSTIFCPYFQLFFFLRITNRSNQRKQKQIEV